MPSPSKLITKLQQLLRSDANVIPKRLRGESLENLPAEVVVDGRREVYGGFRPAQEAAARYMADQGMVYAPPLIPASKKPTSSWPKKRKPNMRPCAARA